MAAKLLHSLTDENPDLQKQIGCMTGVFQMFDRHHILTAPHVPKRLPQGNYHFNNADSGREPNNVHQRSAMEKNSNKNFRERQKVSAESSRASFSSSSRSSSFSSLDCNRTTQLEPLSHNQRVYPKTPSRDPPISPQTTSSQFSRHTLDLRDVVKDSMYREIQGLSVNSKTMPEPTDLDFKYTDSPRPLPNISIDSHGKNLSPWNRNEPRELLRASSYNANYGSTFSISKEAPRFSYEGPVELQEISKSTLMGKDLPRLSLDSKDSSMRNLNANSKSIFSAKNCVQSDSKVENSRQTSGAPSLVAKLMGLETLPEASSAKEMNKCAARIYRDEDCVYSSLSSENLDQFKPVQLSSINLRKEPTSPRWRNPDTVMKPTSRFPIEPAPWKRIDGKRGYQKPASTGTRSPRRVTNTFPSVYNEVEKRLKDLEFPESGKDLRALKQILEAMQAKGLLETEDARQDSSLTSRNDSEGKYMSSTHEPQSDKYVGSTKNIKSSKSFESPIVIMKPAKLVKKSYIASSAEDVSIDNLSGLPKHRGGGSMDDKKGLTRSKMAKDQISKTSLQDNAVISINTNADARTLRTAQNSTRSNHLSKDGPKNSALYSPRVQRKKLDTDKGCQSPTPPDSSKSTRHSNKQPGELNSPGGRRKSKNSNFRQIKDQLSEAGRESRNFRDPEDEISVNSNDATILHPKNAEVITSERSPGIPSGQCSSVKVVESSESGILQKKSHLTVSQEESVEFPPEYPSPVSVLDNTVYTDDSTSPVKLVGKTLKGHSVDNTVPNYMESGTESEMSRKKLENIDNLVQKLQRLNSGHDEARIDYIASLCENNRNPDNRYISEILVASGLILRDLTSSLATFQFHPSGHPINPELFLVLEQTKASTLQKEECSTEKTTQSKEKIRRKLVFDVTNEILAKKLVLAGNFSEPWLRPPHKLARKDLNAQKLLQELCSEIDELQDKNSQCCFSDEDDGLRNMLCRDVIHRSDSWTICQGEISGIVLDVERLIFKDLVDEIVGKATGSRTKPGRRRQLFAK